MGIPGESKTGSAERIPQEWSSFCAFIEKHYQIIFSVALAHVRDGEVAQEITQDVCVRLLLERDKIPPLANPGGWMARVARNTAIDWVRRRQTHSRILAMMESWKADPTAGNYKPVDARNTAINEEEKQRLSAALEQLAPEDREMLVMHFVEGLEKQEIACALEVHPSTVGRRLDRSLAQLRKLIEGFDPELLQGLKPLEHTGKSTMAILGTVLALSAGQKAALAAVAAPLPLLSAGTGAGVVAGSAAGNASVMQKISDIAYRLGQHGQSLVLGAVTVALLAGVYSIVQSKMVRESVKPAQVVSDRASRIELQNLRAKAGGTTERRRKGNAYSQKGLVSSGAQTVGYVPVVTSQTRALRGKVVTEENAPIAGAEVIAWGTSNTSRTVTSEADGSFMFPLLDDGTVILTANAKGFAPTAWQQYVALLPMPAVDDPFTIVMEQPVRLSGRVIDEEGSPLGGAKVTVVKILDKQRQIYNGRADYLKHGSYWKGGLTPGKVVADDSGRFVLEGLRQGYVSLHVEHPERPAIIAEEIKSDSSNAVIALDNGGALEGRVLDGETPLAGVKVNVNGGVEGFTGLNGNGGSAVTDGNGRFSVSGLGVMRSDLSEWSFTASVETSDPVAIPKYLFSISRGESTFSLEMNSNDIGKVDPTYGSIDIRPYYAARTQPEQFGKAELEGTVDLPPELSEDTVIFLSSKLLNDEQPVIDGRFKFSKLPAGDYIATVRVKDRAKQQPSYTTAYAPQRMEVRDGQLHTIRMQPGPCIVKGRVLDADGSASAGSISISTSDALSPHYNSLLFKGFIASHSLSSSGDFEFRGLLPGNYYLAYGSMGLNRVEEIKCREGEVTQVQLQADPLLLVRGEIRMHDGKPASGVRVAIDRAIHGPGKPKRALNRETDGKGRFSGHLSTGTYIILAQPRDKLYPETLVVEVRDGKTTLPLITLGHQPASGILVKPVDVGTELLRTAQFDLIKRSGDTNGKAPTRIYPSAHTVNTITLSGIEPGDYSLVVRSSQLDDWPQHLKPGDAETFSTVVVRDVHVGKDSFTVVSLPLEAGRLVTLRCIPGEEAMDWVNPQFWIKDSGGGVVPVELDNNYQILLGLAPGHYSFGVTLDSGGEESAKFQVLPSEKHTEVELRLQ